MFDGIGKQGVATGKDARRRRRFEARIDDNPQRLAFGFDMTHVQLRVIVAHRAVAGKDCTGA